MDEEAFRIAMVLAENVEGSRFTITPSSLCPIPVTIVNPDVITRYVRSEYDHRNESSPYIYKNRREDIKGKQEITNWECPARK
jgi:hypothetical protein